jgi:8-oxo-dGTP pyrophosphatase MutT (NUDIX family)
VTTTPQAPNFISARAAAGVLFTNEEGEILMVTPSYKDYLDIPGGYVEPGESPAVAAHREVMEELSIAPGVGRLLVVDWWTSGIEQDEGAKILFVFDGGVISPDQLDTIVVDGDEITAFSFCPESALDDLTVPRLANRLRSAMKARSAGAVAYLEDGHIPI